MLVSFPAVHSSPALLVICAEDERTAGNGILVALMCLCLWSHCESEVFVVKFHTKSMLGHKWFTQKVGIGNNFKLPVPEVLPATCCP